MSRYVLVTADFPNVNSTDREKIYKCLVEKKWNKIENVGRDISTVWYASYKDGYNDDFILSDTKNEFVACSSPYTVAKIAIMIGPNPPIVA
ncbi:MAG: hypothetical protein WDA22_01640 [Bacteroidota bacterium]